MKKTSLRVLFWDIETSYLLARIWSPGPKVRIGHEQIVDGWRPNIICISYSWLGENKVHTFDWGKSQDSAQMIEAFTKVIESADLIVGQNSDKFDQKKFNTQRMLHKQKPIAWGTSEDTLKQMRKHFDLPSYRLDYVAKLLTGSGKSPMSMQDWVNVVELKQPKALVKMIKYNQRDVRKLKAVFNRIAPYCTPKIHAGLSTGYGRNACPRCGSAQIRLHGTVLRITGRYQRFQCQSCSTCFRSSKKLP